jgi:two-component system chemotaxis response regulator CheB
MVGIGASTGGPAAVAELLKGLPADFPVPILLVIHIGQSLGSSLAEWLNDQSPIPVRFARDAQPLPAPGYGSGPPGAFMAPGGRHLLVESGRLQLSGAPERFSCRPSVDALFESMAREAPGRCAACLLTGMGQDGAAGLLALRRAGAFTIAQDEASSAVFGMPKEAVALGAARRVLPLGRIAGALAELALGREGPPWD